MLSSKKSEIQFLRMKSVDPTSNLYFDFTSKKSLIGSFDSCDIKISDPHISHYHAIFILEKDGMGEVIDLDSTNGVFINGTKIERGPILPGDILTLGNLNFKIHELDSDIVNRKSIIDRDEDKKKIDFDSSSDITCIIPRVKPPSGDWVLIDGEYCNIKFSNAPKTIDRPPLELVKFDEKAFIDIEEKGKIYSIFRPSKNEKQSIEITTLSNGNILSMDLFSISTKKILLSPDKSRPGQVHVPTLKRNLALPLIAKEKNEIYIKCPQDFEGKNLLKPDFTLNSKSLPQVLGNDDIFSFSDNSIQILARLSDAPPSIKNPPIVGRDTDFLKLLIALLPTLFGITLMLLLVETHDPKEEKKKVAVIYKPKPKAKINKEKTSEKVAQNEAPKSEPKKDPPKDIQTPKQIAKPIQKQKVVQKGPPPKPTKPTKVAEKKSFKLNSKRFSNIFSKKPTRIQTTSSTNNKSFADSSPATSTNVTGLNMKSKNVSTLGGNFSSGYNTSTGSSGLASKKGVESAFEGVTYVDQSSIDPKLVKKILGEYLPQFQHCYQQELLVNENAKGTLDLNFNVNKDGKIVKVKIGTSRQSFSAKGINCMKKILNLIKFPKPKGGGEYNIRQPLNFSSERKGL